MALVYYYRGDFKGLTSLFGSYKDLAESLDDRAELGMFYGWLGMAMHCREQFRNAHEYLSRALNLDVIYYLGYFSPYER